MGFDGTMRYPTARVKYLFGRSRDMGGAKNRIVEEEPTHTT
jgi:hypothetical protein